MLTGRQLILKWLQDEVRQASLADLQRAAAFLEFARRVREGCAAQRSESRRLQSSAWRKYADDPARW